ncbi:thioester domain-containing protein [Actinosynnema sp. NPDC023587]|uniref:thioester domain-containing protein n=1 Tax=Actinosynnema sp. NPDC023587 TaxID=3154695 RepID=UPI0033EA9798
MAPRLTLKRMGAAVLGASLLFMSALPAAADAVKVTPDAGADEPGMGLNLIDKDGKPVDAGGTNAKLIGLKIIENGKSQTATAYCVELPTRLLDNTPLEEVPWNEHPNSNTKFKENAAKVNWILHNSYPTVPFKDVAEAAGVPDLKTVKVSAVIVATQAAIWHFTDEITLDEKNSTVEDEDNVDEDVLAIYKKLTGPDNVGIGDEPAPTLTVDPKELEGSAGSLIGPFTVKTTADKVIVEAGIPQGVALTDKDGKPLDVVQQGDLSAKAETKVGEIFIKVDEGVAPGSVEFTVRATAQLHHGRLFVASDRNKQTQSLVIAKPTQVDALDKAKAKWSENTTTTTPTTTTTSPAEATTTTTTTVAPTTTTTEAPAGPGGNEDDLASTGASIFVPLLIGLGLLGAGAAAMIIVRRKKTA